MPLLKRQDGGRCVSILLTVFYVRREHTNGIENRTEVAGVGKLSGKMTKASQQK